MLPFKLIYSDGYDLSLGAHVFPSQKFKWIREKCLAEGLAGPDDFLAPEPALDEDILRVHTQEWVRKLKTGKLAPWELMRLEIPWSAATQRAFWLSAGGSTLAARRALADGCAFNLGGGFHHAYPDHGEGFCPIHDVAVAIRSLQASGAIATAMVVDLDVHHGNGTAAIFAADPSVFTLSMHQENNYPYPKPPSDIDVGLPDATGDDEYLRLLDDALVQSFAKFAENAALRTEQRAHPDLLWYLAGADPYLEDQLGGLALTIKGLMERDRKVIQAARDRGIPIAITFAGGYARRVEDTVQIHVNTILAARESFATASKPR
ncbi:MAG TPA: histone deacetylase [Candidatus Xenobia bacterium]|nr:histone deacetylase [Candidatus Xenobia bacterium]